MRKPSIGDAIYDTIKERIATFRYQPGAILNEGELALEFNASRTPVREALHRLEQDRLLSLSKAGAMIAPMDFIWIRNAYEVRKPLEAQMARHACQRGSDEEIQRLLRMAEPLRKSPEALSVEELFACDKSIHLHIMTMTRNLAYKVFYDSAYAMFTRFSYYCQQNGVRYDSVPLTLAAQVDAIAARDVQLAEQCAVAHLEVHAGPAGFTWGDAP